MEQDRAKTIEEQRAEQIEQARLDREELKLEVRMMAKDVELLVDLLVDIGVITRMSLRKLKK